MNDKKSHFQINEKDTASPYAIWSITYDANGGTNAPAKQTANVGQSITITRNEPTRSGYTFLGWNSWSGATEPDPAYTPGNVYKSDYNITLYAVWDGPGSGGGGGGGGSYYLNFDLQGGYGTFNTLYGNYGDAVQLPYNSPTKNGYRFLGWSTYSTGNPEYQPGEYYTLYWSSTLYAVWEQNVTRTWTITYNANGGSGAPSPQTANVGQSITITYSKPTRSGYTFLGWATWSGATQPEFNPGSSYRSDYNVTLYAVWKQQMCTIVYDLQGGSGNFPDMNTYYGNSFKLRSEIPTKNGYVFKGWATSPAGNPVYQPSDIYKALGNATLYAVWEKVKKTFTITYDKNTTDTVTGMPTTQTKTEGIGISLSENIPVRDEYIFVHWSESSSDSGTSYNPGDLYTKDGNVTLYAIWKQEHKNMYIGSSSVSSIYIGRDKVTAMYIGTTKVW